MIALAVACRDGQEYMSKKKKRMTGSERRLQIVEAAEGLFARRGFRGTTTREIANAAGVSEATIFKHFRRKADLYQAIIESRLSDSKGDFVLIKRLEGKAGVEAFRELAMFIMERYAEDPTFSRLLLFSALEANEMSDMVVASKGVETLKYLAKEVRKLVKAGEFRRVDPHLAARAFLGMVSHYCMLQEIYGYKRFFTCKPDKVVDTFMDIFVGGMSVEKMPPDKTIIKKVTTKKALTKKATTKKVKKSGRKNK